MQNYLLSISNNELLKNGTIHDPDTKLKVKVIDDTIKAKVTPRQGEIRYFVTAGNETIAFETEGYKKHRQLLILRMISWYCLYLGLIEARIHSSWPL